ncbi:2'-5' RNA ligase family protein [Halovenus marina]|uniref:2'-5' RNA ligase family protein n=1 Tax=Halovenus marina TaxID=3396621 RepID=UPI003F57EA12
MYSLNVPVPANVAALAGDIARELPGARERERGEHTLGVKRLGGDGVEEYNRLEARVRELLVGQPAFEIRITDLSYFPEAITGPTPVIYLAVESPELRRLHLRLAEVFDPIEGIEGEGYTPHVTVARGGSTERAKAVTDRDIDPIEWTVTELCFWDARHSETVSTVSLPA